jgi:hypothetical protein
MACFAQTTNQQPSAVVFSVTLSVVEMLLNIIYCIVLYNSCSSGVSKVFGSLVVICLLWLFSLLIINNEMILAMPSARAFHYNLFPPHMPMPKGFSFQSLLLKLPQGLPFGFSNLFSFLKKVFKSLVVRVINFGCPSPACYSKIYNPYKILIYMFNP